jgi:hypothetical protein
MPNRVEPFEHAVREVVAFFEAHMICADKYQTEVDSLETDIDMEHELFGATRDANWSPCLATAH